MSLTITGWKVYLSVTTQFQSVIVFSSIRITLKSMDYLISLSIAKKKIGFYNKVQVDEGETNALEIINSND